MVHPKPAQYNAAVRMKPFAARIHVLLAARAPLGVVIRRGPSKRVCTILWNRARDEFQLGQWLKGRIFERRSDLSPDGKYLIYFAMNGKWKSDVKGSWTAISRAPYLKALALFSKGDCWHGGGLFTGKTTYWLNDGRGHDELRTTSSVRRDATFQPSESFGGECPGVYFPRLLRDGWTFIERGTAGKWKVFEIFEKPATRGWILRKIAHAEVRHPPGKGVYWDEHQLLHPKTGACIPCPDWEWADTDRKRLVWAARGKLFGADLQQEGLSTAAELFDFNAMKFEPIEAPY
jgi:hypothetical protein